MNFIRWVKKFYQFLIGSTDDWREQIFSVLTRVALIIAVPASIISIFTSLLTWKVHDIDFMINGFLLWLLLTFNQKLSFRFRAGLGLTLFFFLSIFLILRDGYLGTGPVYLIVYIVLTGLLLGARDSLLSLVLEAVFLILMGVLIRSERLPFYWVEFTSTRTWFVNSFTVLLVSSAVALSIAFLVQFLENAIQGAQKYSQDLINSNKQLKKEIQERIEAEEKAAKSQQQLISMFNNFPEPLYVCDPFTYRIEFINAALQKIVQEFSSKETIVGEVCYKALQGLDEPCSFCTNEIILQNNEPYSWEHFNQITNRHYMVTDRIIDWSDDRKMRMGVAIDITERKLAEEQLMHDALHDSLTGLANRKLFLQRLEHTIAVNRRDPECRSAVLFFDFDNFKLINDTYGHSYGDQLLIEIAGRLTSIVREVDLVARLGGDEFVILLEDFYPQGTLFMITDRIMESLRKPFIINGQEMITTASIGIVAEIKEGLTADDIIRDADIAMYQAKEHGRNKYVVFREDMRQAIFARSVIEQDLRRGIVLREFEIFYQPILTTNTKHIAGFEALIRWNHPLKGIQLPKDFWGAAEELGLTVDIGKLVIQNAIRQVKVWQEKFCTPNEKYKLSLNFSSKQLQDQRLISFLKETLDEYDFDPLILNIDITEELMGQLSPAYSEQLTGFHNLGIHLHLDNVRKNAVSLGTLKNLTFDTIKIDRGLINSIHISPQNHDLIQSIIKLARDLNMKTIAEGVENQKQLSILSDMGCDYWQGYFYSQPLPAQEMEKILQKPA
ncbi:MAG: hypothetical protein CL609_20930 [Anaerolineaceae bacterium]|nr:hypothetical protein [Anaerolineaceae bacterium]